ncbi:MAG: hypothetical protein AB1452_00760 [Pseudomonadota bacterium]
MTLVAILTVRREAIDKFRAFEAHAAEVMKRHGGRIERTIVVDPDDSPGLMREIHVVTFPSEETFAAYRKDARLAELAHLRDQSVVHTELFVGQDGPSYAAG